MIIRLYTGDDGQAHFEDLNVPAGETETIALKAGADMTFRSMEIGIGDGTKRVLDPGDILQVEDLTGQGHTTRSVGNRISASVALDLPG